MDETLTGSARKVKMQLEALVELQRVDDEILKRQDDIKHLQQQLSDEDKKIQNLKDTLASEKSEMDKLLKDRRSAETDLKQKQEMIQKLGGQLYDVKTNDAYQTLQQEIKQKKQENSVLEERILEMMMAEDEVKQKMLKAESAYKMNEKGILDQQAALRQAIADIENNMAEFNARWETAAKAVQADYLDLYQRLRKSKGGRAMAKIENEVCTGCRLSIRPQAAIELQKYRSLLFCDNCARILYVE